MGALPLQSLRSRSLLPFLLNLFFSTVAFFFFLHVLYPRDHAPATSKHTKALVIASTSAKEERNSAWLSDVPMDWDLYYYSVDNPISPMLAVPDNRGNEAMVYLTYIIDYYHDLPDVVLFHHDHLRAWHQELDSITEVVGLRTQYVVDEGFVSTRCLGNCENVMPVAQKVPPLAGLRKKTPRDEQLSALLNVFLEPGREAVPEVIAAPCCAQFAASREAIQGRSRDWWAQLRQWLIETPLPSAQSGRLIEWTWHIWLGQESVL
ncbi:hypothetical protein F5Y15DRAFT_415759 [Xylariaceae sp. FL0016]|nr:hypothetical protein F5Y15DRAFT_415759 [Xylariaceae sp. FL0016]